MDALPPTHLLNPPRPLFDADFMRELETPHPLARNLFRGQNRNDRTS